MDEDAEMAAWAQQEQEQREQQEESLRRGWMALAELRAMNKDFDLTFHQTLTGTCK